MEIVLGVIGVALVTTGAVLIYFFPPNRGYGIAWRDPPEHDKHLARAGLSLVIVGSALQALALIIAAN